jgi:formate hydrogenlyase subunit 4
MVIVAVLAAGLAWFTAALLLGMLIGGAARMRDRVGVPVSGPHRRDEGLRLLV